MADPTASNGATAEEIAALRAGFREATRHGFDGAKVAEWSAELDERAERLGLDPDRLASQLFASGIASAFAAYNANKAREADLLRSVRGEQRRQLRRRLDHVGEQSYRSQVVVVRELHGDLTGRRVCEFLGLVTRPRQPRSNAARARRPRRSSSSSRTSGVDPGDGDDGESEPAGVAAHACRRRTAGGRP